MVDIDYEAIAWALSKLRACGIGTSKPESAQMLDRLEAMLWGDISNLQA